MAIAGIAAAWGMTAAIGALAKSLALPAVEERARVVAPRATIAGAVIALSPMTHATGSAFAAIVVVLPLALAALVAWLRAALAVRGAINERLDADAD
jgi:hypothetical protein